MIRVVVHPTQCDYNVGSQKLRHVGRLIVPTVGQPTFRLMGDNQWVNSDTRSERCESDI
jgi:hypothetical protein